MCSDRAGSDPGVGVGDRHGERERAARLGLLAAFRNLRLQLSAVLPIIDRARIVWALDAFERLLDCPDLQVHIGRSRAARLGFREEAGRARRPRVLSKGVER